MVEYIKVKMLTTVKGAVDSTGTIIEEHKAGCEYDLPDYLAKVYLDAKYAEPVAVEPVEVEEPPKSKGPVKVKVDDPVKNKNGRKKA